MPKLMTATGDEMTALIGSMTAAGQAVEAAMTSAKAEYDKILPLTGVEDYVTYANMQNDVIAMYNSLLEAGSAMIEKYLPEITAGTLDLTALLSGPRVPADPADRQGHRDPGPEEPGLQVGEEARSVSKANDEGGPHRGPSFSYA